MNWLFRLLMALACMALVACEGGCGGKLPIPTTPRERARAVVLVLAEGTKEADHQCAMHGRDAGDLALLDRCTKAYDTARSSLLAAAGTVDAYDEGKAGDTACATIRGADAAAELAGLLASSGAPVPSALSDGLALYKQFGAGLCPTDGVRQ